MVPIVITIAAKFLLAFWLSIMAFHHNLIFCPNNVHGNDIVNKCNKQCISLYLALVYLD